MFAENSVQRISFQNTDVKVSIDQSYLLSGPGIHGPSNRSDRFQRQNYFLGNRFLRDLAEDDETEFDRISMHPSHEQTHNSRNHTEFNNVTSNLKEVRLAINFHLPNLTLHAKSCSKITLYFLEKKER